jgi:polyhydroxyalkanoate synthase subunit PhaE
MTESEKNPLDPIYMADTWFKSMSEVWSQMTNAGLVSASPQKQENKSDKKNNRFDQHIESSLNAWQAYISAMSRPETAASVFKGISSMPDIFMKMIQPALTSVSDMHQQWLEQIEKTGRISEPFQFDRMDKDALNIFNKLYDAEFRKFLKIPQLGLAREHQEKLNRFIDRFNLLSGAVAEFLQVIFQPFEKSYASLQEKIADLTKENEIPDDPKYYYQLWLKILEREYMMLFKTPEYLTSLAKTINVAAEYKRAKQDLSNDLLHYLSIPSATDIQDVYKDLHDLKKRLRNIEKKTNN